MTVLVQLTVAGTDVGPFNIYSNVNYSIPIPPTNVSKSDLLAGYPVEVDPATTVIRVQSQGQCKNQIDINVSGTTPAFYYIATLTDCAACGTSRPGNIYVRSSSALTIGKWYTTVDPPYDSAYLITGNSGSANTGAILNATSESVSCVTVCGAIS